MVATAGPDFTRVAAQTVTAVTNISSIQVVRRPNSPFANDPFFQYFFGDDRARCSATRTATSRASARACVISADGYVVTNNHVVGEGDAEVTVTVGDRRERAGEDHRRRLVDRPGAAQDRRHRTCRSIPWGDSSKLKVAEWVMAVGNPFSLSQTVTLGVVSALGRANVGISHYEDFIQTDAAINPGNSGGALINSRGELVGINTAIFSQSGGYQGIGFAVPSNLVRRVVDDLKKFGEVRRGSIGYVEVIAAHVAAGRRTARAQHRRRRRSRRCGGSSAAYQAGLQPGDIISVASTARRSPTRRSSCG